MDIRVRDVLVDLLLDCSPADQDIQLLPDLLIRVENQIFYDGIGRSIGPVWFRKRIWQGQMLVDIFGQAPRIVDIAVSEEISVIPFSYLFRFFFFFLIRKQLHGFFFRKAECFRKAA